MVCKPLFREKPRMSTRRYVLGLVPSSGLPATDDGRNQLTQWLGERSGEYVVRREVQSYDELARLMLAGTIDLAWLPPLVYLELERRGGAEPLVTSRRAGQTEYSCVLVVRQSSSIQTLEHLRGSRAAWVDPLSASGYVYPRIQLAALGLDPRALFLHEGFFGSHAASLRAVADGTADVAATFATHDGAGVISRGGWSELSPMGGLRVLWKLGTLPMDLVAVRPDVPLSVRGPLARAFADACADDRMRGVARRIFGVDEFCPEGFASYDGLRASVFAALEAGLIDASSAYIATLPPPGN
jgi:phosphate/phosphite/phosphonate ABC transporter binding protein